MKKNKKITFVTAVWRRPEIFAIFAKGIHHLIKENPEVDIEVCVAGSEGNRSKNMVEKAGFLYVEEQNEPLGRKMNAASQLAEKTDADYYILVGSDDVINDKLFKRYLDYTNYKYDYIYLTDCYFYNIETKQSLYWAGYNQKSNRGHALGAGRVLSKKIMKKVNFKCWYDTKMSHVLDTAFDRIVEPHIKSRRALNCRKDNIAILDIKSDVNMTPYKVWPNSTIIHSGFILKEFGHLFEQETESEELEEQREYIDKIYNTTHKYHPSNQIHETVIIYDNVKIGKNNVIGPYTVIGSNGEIRKSKKFDGNFEGCVEIGDDNIISELVTIQRPSKKGEATKVGSGNIIMAHSHIGHDSNIGNSCEICTGTILGGYCIIENDVKLKLNVTIRNRKTVGAQSIIGMGSVVTKDVPPGSLQVGNPAKEMKLKVTG